MKGRRPPETAPRTYRPKPPDEIRRNMAAIRSTENRTETLLRSHLHRLGLRFRKYSRNLPGSPDIVFKSARLVVFVDGDYWHARVLRERGADFFLQTFRSPNRDYWVPKFQRRIARDDHVTATLRNDGWDVLRFWESEVKAQPDQVARRILARVRRREKELAGASTSREQAT